MEPFNDEKFKYTPVPNRHISFWALVDPRGRDLDSKGRACIPSIISHPLIFSDVLDNATTPLHAKFGVVALALSFLIDIFC